MKKQLIGVANSNNIFIYFQVWNLDLFIEFNHYKDMEK